MGLKISDKRINESKITLKELRKKGVKTIGVDFNIWLYGAKGKIINGDWFRDSSGRNTSLIFHFTQMIEKYVSHGFHLIFVTDGKQPLHKENTIIERRNLRREQRLVREEFFEWFDSQTLEVQQEFLEEEERNRKAHLNFKGEDVEALINFITNSGFDIHRPEGEADVFLHYLYKTGKIDAVASTDIDFFVRGIPYLLKTGDLSLDLSLYLQKTGLTLEEFQTCSYLLQNDYNAKPLVPRSGIVTLSKKLRGQDLKAKVKELVQPEDYPLYELAKNAFTNSEATTVNSIYGIPSIDWLKKELRSYEINQKLVDKYLSAIMSIQYIIDGPTYTSSNNYHFGTLYNFALKSIFSNYHGIKFRKTWDSLGLPNWNYVCNLYGLDKKKFDQDISIVEKVVRENIVKLRSQFKNHFPETLKRDTGEDISTILPEYIVHSFSTFYKAYNNGLISNELTIQPFCTGDCGHLANAEIDESKSKIDQLIYSVKTGQDIELLVFTTTPHSYPMVEYIGYDNSFDYGLYNYQGRRILVLKDTLEWLQEKIGPVEFIENFKPLSLGTSVKLKGFKNNVEFINIEDVNKERNFVDVKNTGFVHFVPSFASTDLLLSQTLKREIVIPEKYNLSKLQAEHHEEICRSNYTSKDKYILENVLGSRVLYYKKIDSIMSFCGRCKNKVIDFIKDGVLLNYTPLKPFIEEISEKIDWKPAWAKTSQSQWIKNLQGHWNLSRERPWGTPIPLFHCNNCQRIETFQNHVDSNEILLKGMTGVQGIVSFISSLTIPCDCGSEMNWIKKTLDVWWDAGLMLTFTYNLFQSQGGTIIEGIDQFRGWFHVLLVTAALEKFINDKEKPIVDRIIVHGFVLGEGKEKLSKSKGDVIGDLTHEDVELLTVDMIGSSKIGKSANVNEKVNRKSKSLRNLLKNIIHLSRLKSTEKLEEIPISVYNHTLKQRQLLEQEFEENFDLWSVFNMFYNEITWLSRTYVNYYKNIGDGTIPLLSDILFQYRRIIRTFFPSLDMNLLPVCSNIPQTSRDFTDVLDYFQYIKSIEGLKVHKGLQGKFIGQFITPTFSKKYQDLIGEQLNEYLKIEGEIKQIECVDVSFEEVEIPFREVVIKAIKTFRKENQLDLSSKPLLNVSCEQKLSEKDLNFTMLKTNTTIEYSQGPLSIELIKN